MSFDTLARSSADVESVIESVVEHKPQPASATLKHYGISMLIDIPLLHYIGSQQFVPTKYIQGFEYWPKFTLLPFDNIEVNTPPMRAARKAAVGSVDDLAAPFDPDLAEEALGNGAAFNKVRKTALQCATFANELFRESGFGLLASLTGYENATANTLLEVFLPLKRMREKAAPRYILGERFLSPFLDEVLEFLTSESPKLIEDARLDDDSKEKLLVIHTDFVDVARHAWDAANTILNETEADLQADPSQKKSYDRRDRRFANAAEPRDLVCLAHTGRKPLDEKALANAQKLQQSANEPMTQAAAALTKAAEALGGAKAVSGPTDAEIDALVEQRVQERLQAAGVSDNTSTADTTVAKCQGLKKDQTQCHGNALSGSDYCPAHQSQGQPATQ